MHGNHLRFLVRHLNTDGTFTRHRGDDTDARSGKGHHDIVLERLDLRYANTGFGNDLIERDGWSDGCFDGLDLNAVVAQGSDDTRAVGPLLFFVNDRCSFVVLDLEQVERRELKELEVFARVVRTLKFEDGLGVLGVQFIGNDVSDDQLIVVIGLAFGLFGLVFGF